VSPGAQQLPIPLAALAAAVVTFGLFLFMHQLVSMGQREHPELEHVAGIYFGKVEIPRNDLAPSRRTPPEPPVLAKPPRTPQLQASPMTPQSRGLPQLDLPDLDVPLVSGSGMFIGELAPSTRAAEGDIIPVVVIRPLYPRDAAMAGIEGWVKVEFTIAEDGTVKNPVIVDAQPPRIFNREAIRAILKWKFKPRVVAGVAVERRATQVIDFSLNDATR
jgi:protein TonB